MSAQIAIFLLFTSVTLVFNSMVIWFAYKAFANVTTRVTETMREVHANDDARSWLRALEAASVQAVSVTEVAKQSIGQFEPTLARAQSKFGYGLAKVDVRLERFHDKLSVQAEKGQNAIVAPAFRIGATLSGIIEVLRQITAGSAAGDARSTRKR